MFYVWIYEQSLSLKKKCVYIYKYIYIVCICDKRHVWSIYIYDVCVYILICI